MLRSMFRVSLVGVSLFGCASGPKEAEGPAPAEEPASSPAPPPEASAAPRPAASGNLSGTEVESPTGGLGTSGAGSESTAKPKRIRVDPATVNGRLPAEVIRQLIRKNFGAFRKCYEAGLGRDPKLEGLVLTRFVIERDGSVSNVDTSKSEIADSEVATCVGASFETLRFPEPDGGIVRVTYPIRFSPG